MIQSTSNNLTPILIEAEDLSLDNYVSESGNFASGQTLIKVGDNGNQGTATLNFSGTPGTYDLTVAYFDETDGISTIEVDVDGVQADSWSLNQNLGGTRASAENRVERTLNQIALNSGSTVVITGFRNSGERARIDFIQLHPLDVEPENTNPEAANDDYSVVENNTLTVDSIAGVLNNDTDADGDNLSVSDFDSTSTEEGTVNLNNDGSFSYIPAPDFVGTDSFSYTVSDGNGGTDTATVTVEVTSDNIAPEATNDSYTVEENNTLTVDSIAGVLNNDTDADGDNLSVSDFDSTSTEEGTVNLNTDGSFSYIPAPDFVGTDSFSYTVSDGNGGTDTATVTVEVTSDNIAPEATNDSYTLEENNTLTVDSIAGVLNNDTDADGDNLSVSDFDSTSTEGGTVNLNSDGSFSYTPAPDFIGTDSFSYTVSDGKGGTDIATVTVEVTADENEFLQGTNEDDLIKGLTGNDTIVGLEGNDSLFGNGNRDSLSGDEGNDNLKGGGGRDTVDGGADDDRVSGNNGNDLVIGGTGKDKVWGNNGDDTLIGVDPNSETPGLNEIDLLTGGTGADTFVLGNGIQSFYDDGLTGNGNTDRATIKDFDKASGDLIQLHGTPGEYQLKLVPNQDPKHTQIRYNGEIIALVQNVTDLDLNGSEFRYVLDTTAPQASLMVTDVTESGAAFQTFDVTYTDDEAVKISTFDANDIFVLGPNGFNGEATFLGADSNSNGTPVTASYQVDAPGGSWDDADNGTYTIVLRDEEVSDTQGNFIVGETLGSFQVDVPEPIIDTTPPTPALTASNVTNVGETTYQFTVTYTDDIAVNSTTVDNQDTRITGPGGFDQAATLVNTVINNDGTVVTATYEIITPGGGWTETDNGIYTISLEENQVSDTSDNFIPGSNLGSFEVNLLDTVGQYDVFEQSFTDAGNYSNPYTQLSATATLTAPDNQTYSIPLFWDGGDTWKFRFAPELQGEWNWTIDSADSGLDNQSGSFNVIASDNSGGIEARPDYPYHFQHQDGTPFYFFGDTNWRLGQTNAGEDLNHDTALEYLDIRASQGFNYIHTNFAYGPNEGGPLWDGTSGRDLNPGYFQELDRRIEYMNDLGITTGYMLEWAQGWNTAFSSQADRLQYAEYITARYSAHNVVFIVSGEYDETLNANVYREIGQTIDATDPHDRMITIHSTGPVEEFADESWMSFGDYQQLYFNLHDRLLQSRDHDKPVVNSEYAYYLRDSNGDGVVDKPNSATLEQIRHASYEIVMTGGYLVTGWGTTYFGGHRDPGPFNPNDPRNDDWEEDVQHIKTLFTDQEWWKLEPRDELINGPGTEYLLAEPGEQYIAYMRGDNGNYSIDLDTSTVATYNIQQFDPREGTYTDVGTYTGNGTVTLTVPDDQDWVYVLSNQVRPV